MKTTKGLMKRQKILWLELGPSTAINVTTSTLTGAYVLKNVVQCFTLRRLNS